MFSLPPLCYVGTRRGADGRFRWCSCRRIRRTACRATDPNYSGNARRWNHCPRAEALPEMRDRASLISVTRDWVESLEGGKEPMGGAARRPSIRARLRVQWDRPLESQRAAWV